MNNEKSQIEKVTFKPKASNIEYNPIPRTSKPSITNENEILNQSNGNRT